MDGARVQLDYILADGHVTVQQVWHDYIVPIGLDHRCVHCILQWSGARPPPKHRRINLKNWAPKLDEHGTASSFCNCLTEQLTRIQDKTVFGKVFGTNWEVAWDIWFEKTSFQTFRGFATPAVAQTDCL